MKSEILRPLEKFGSLPWEEQQRQVCSTWEDEEFTDWVEKEFKRKYGKTGRLDSVTANVGSENFLVVRVNQGLGKTRVPSKFMGMIVRKWYTN